MRSFVTPKPEVFIDAPPHRRTRRKESNLAVYSRDTRQLFRVALHMYANDTIAVRLERLRRLELALEIAQQRPLAIEQHELELHAAAKAQMRRIEELRD